MSKPIKLSAVEAKAFISKNGNVFSFTVYKPSGVIPICHGTVESNGGISYNITPPTAKVEPRIVLRKIRQEISKVTA